MHVQSCDFAENNYFFDVVIVLSWWWLLKLPITSGRSRGAGPGAASSPPRYPKDWIPGSTTHYCIKSSCSGAKLEKFCPPTLDHF